MRIIIFSGKGGCGTSTMAAGTACLLAGAGMTVVLAAVTVERLDRERDALLDRIDRVEPAASARDGVPPMRPVASS